MTASIPYAGSPPPMSLPAERLANDDDRAWSRLRRGILADATGAEVGPMMTGCVDYPVVRSMPKPKVYSVIARAGGWSILLNGACTRPFRTRSAASRIARTLQRQADALSDGRR